MTEYPTDIHASADEAPQVTNLYARCANCGDEWPILSSDMTDAESCGFCGAGKKAISIHREGPQGGRTTIHGKP